MRRLWVLACAVALTATACPGSEPPEPGERLTELAYEADESDYVVTYRYTMEGELAEAVQTRMQVIHQPPTVLRMTETTTLTEDGSEVAIPQWLIQREDDHWACTRYADGLRCVEAPGTAGMFGYAPVDDMFDRVRDPEAFEEVTEEEPQSIAGEPAFCFVATPPPDPTPAPRTPEIFIPTEFSFELCYTEDGILLRARRTITGEMPDEVQERRQSTLEAVEVRRQITPGELGLPDEVQEVARFRPSETPEPD